MSVLNREGLPEWKLDQPVPLPDRGNDILTVGELLVDMISTDYGDPSEADTYRRFFGGSPSNIAMNVKKLGIRPLVASAVGHDGLGQFLIRRLEEAGISTATIQRTDASTSMVVVSKSRGTPVPIFYRGADSRLGYTPELESALLRSRIVHFSCWPLSMEPGRSTIEKVMETARRNQILVGFDPNYHPMVWQRGENGIDVVKSMIGRADIVKPSEDDAERLFGADTPENQLNKFLELGAKLVILTLGKDGAIVSNGAETLRCRSLATEVTDTTGAGDAFWSGFYAALVKGYTVRDALSCGFAVSAFKLKHMGAVVDLPQLGTIRELYGLQEGEAV